MKWILKFIGYYILEIIIGIILILHLATRGPYWGFLIFYLPQSAFISAVGVLLVQLKWRLENWKFLLIALLFSPIGLFSYIYLAETFQLY